MFMPNLRIPEDPTSKDTSLEYGARVPIVQNSLAQGLSLGT